MKSKISIFVVTSLFCAITQAMGETTPTFPKIVPVSPNAAALGIYGTIPVSYYTGVPNITLPMYEVELDGKKIPISFSYHASGVKVMQEASTVGLGWVLNAGGCITKEIRSWDDFQKSPTGYYFDTELPAPTSNNDWDTTLSPDILARFKGYAGGSYDAEPDLFHFNFASFSGSCFFKKMNANGNTENSAKAIIRNGKENLKIQYFIVGGICNEEDYWIVTDADGFKYHFHTNEKTTTYISDANVDRTYFKYKPNQPYATTSWYLDSIVSPTHKRISFSYSKDNIYTHVSYSEYVYRLINMQSDCYHNEDGLLTANEYSYPYTYSKNEQVLLKEITLPNGTVIVNYSDRNDIESVDTKNKARKIDNIVVQNNTGTTIERIKLNQSYIGSLSLSDTQKRLMLDSLNINNKTYAFSYYNRRIGLPEKDNAHADYWGYYNHSNVSYSTDFRLAPSTVIQDGNDYYYLTGKDNQPNEEYMKIGTLTAIQYPTGGKSVFDYETHDFSNSISGSVDEKTVGSYSYFYDEMNPNESNFKEYSDEFEVTDETPKGTLKIDYYRYTSNDSRTVPAIITVQRKTSSTGFENIQRCDIECLEGESNRKTEKLPIIFPSAGTYRIRISTDSLLYPNINVSIQCPFTKKINKGGGLRIKSISDYTNATNYTKRTFNYQRDGISTGLLMNQLDNIICIKDNLQTLSNGRICSVGILGIIASSSPWTPFSNSASGQSVGYSYVEEAVVNSTGNNGKTVYGFTNQEDRVIDVHDRLIKGYPSLPNLNNGSLLSTTYYDNQDHIIKKEEFEYCKLDSDSIKGLMCYKPAIFGGISGDGINLKYYDLYSERWVLNKKNESWLYGDKWLSQTAEYQYDSNNWLINNEKTINSTNDTLSHTIKYPHDYTTDPYISMVNNNMLSPAVENASFKNNVLLQKTITNYKNWGNNIFAPETVQLQTSQQINPETRLTYYNYDAKGNPLHITKDGAAKISYLWSYNYQYPVAKIEGLTYDEVESAIGENTINTLAANSNPTKSEIEQIRSSITASGKMGMVSTYTYIPLIGMATATDPRGITTNYTYDSFNRLFLARNDDKNIVAKYSYGYQNNPDDGMGGYSQISVKINDYNTVYLQGTVGTATATVSDGSGDYSYAWSLTNSNGTSLATGSAQSFSFNCTETGDLTISCRVTDQLTGSYKDQSQTFHCFPPPESYINLSSSTCVVGSSVNISLFTEQGSGVCSYVWTVTNSSGQNQTLTDNTASLIQLTLTETGVYNITCVVTDKNTLATYTAEATLTCKNNDPTPLPVGSTITSYYYFYDDMNPDESNYEEYSDEFEVQSSNLNNIVTIQYYRLSDVGYSDQTAPAAIIIQKKTDASYGSIKTYNVECAAGENNLKQVNYPICFPSAGTYRIRISSYPSLHPMILVIIKTK